MGSFIPQWHPSLAKDYFSLYNNINKKDGILYYDTTNKNISIPKTFYFNREDSTYNLQVDKVITNSNSSDATISSNKTDGNFKINTLKPDKGQSLPTIDIYVSGNIRKGGISKKVKKDNEVTSPTSVSFEASYNINPTRFSDGEIVGVNWGRGLATFDPPGFTDSGNNYYEYLEEGDYVVFKNNWNSDTIQGFNSNQNNYKYFANGIDLDNLNVIPRITCTWEILWGYECASYCECDGNDEEGCEGDSCEGDEGHQEWTGVLTAGLVIRNAYCERIDVTKTIYPTAGTEVTVYSEAGGFYYCLVPVYEYNSPDGYDYYEYDCEIDKQYVRKN